MCESVHINRLIDRYPLVHSRRRESAHIGTRHTTTTTTKERVGPEVVSLAFRLVEIWFREPFLRWGFLGFRVRVRFTYGEEFTRK